MGEETVVELAAQRASTRAAEALSALVGQPLTPATEVGESRLPGPPEPVTRTRFGVQGYEDGEFEATFPDSSIRVVREMLAPGMEESAEANNNIALEVGNICVSQFLAALGDMLHSPLVPSPPSLAHEPVARAPTGGFVIRTDFRTPAGDVFHGTLHFNPPPGLLEALRKSSP